MAQRDLREPGNAALHAQPHLQHLLVRTAAAVAVTVSHQDGAIDLLGLVTLQPPITDEGQSTPL